MRKLILCIAALATGAAVLLPQTAQFPTTVATSNQLKVAGNRIQSTLSTNMTAADTAIVVASGTGFAANMLVSIGSEVISICGVSGNILLVGASTASCPNVDGRGYDGTSAASHATGTCSATNTTGCVSNYNASWYHNALRVEMLAMQKWQAPVANIKAFGATCDWNGSTGTDNYSAVAAALAAGAKTIFTPAACMWVAPSGVVTSTLANPITYVGESAYTSVMRSSAAPLSLAFSIGPGGTISRMNAQSSNCDLTGISPNCPVPFYHNQRDVSAGVISTAYSAFLLQVGQSGLDTAGANIQNYGVGDGWFISNHDNGSGLRVDQESTNGAGIYLGRKSTGPGMFIADLAGATGGQMLGLFSTLRTSGDMFNITHQTSSYSGRAFSIDMASTYSGVPFTYAKSGGATVTITNAGQFSTDLATGTAPLVITSTTPVTNLTAQVRAYKAGTQQTNSYVQFGKCTLGTDCAVTLSPAYTSSSSYQCTGTDQTAAAAVKVVNTSSSVATFTGTGTDVIAFTCVGN